MVHCSISLPDFDSVLGGWAKHTHLENQFENCHKLTLPCLRTRMVSESYWIVKHEAAVTSVMGRYVE
jgi:hypothetical protein